MPEARRGSGDTDPGAQRLLADRLGGIEQMLYSAVAAALVLAGAGLFGWSIVDFVRSLTRHVTFEQSILRLLDSLLLVFIVTELLHTVRGVIAQNILIAEPFLIVGVIAAIRRVIVITAEAPTTVSSDRFTDLLWEIAVLSGAVLVFGTVIFLLRHTSKSEPVPAHDPEPTVGEAASSELD